MDLDQLLKSRVHCTLPDMENAVVTKDHVYTTAEGIELMMDVYRPHDVPHDQPLPAVLFVHGEAPWELVKEARMWGQYTSWGQLAAASGLVGITFTRREAKGFTCLPEVVQDMDAALDFVRQNAAQFGIDADRLGLWVCSAGGPVGLRTVLREKPSYIRCIAAYYPALDLRPYPELLEYMSEEELRDFSPLYHLEQGAEYMPPLLLTKAGLDSPTFNDPIDQFAKEVLSRNPSFTYLVHDEGHHGFDMRDDVPRTQEIVLETLSFLRKHLTV